MGHVANRLMRYEIDDRDAAFTSWRTEHFIDAAVRNIQLRPIAARVESVCPDTGLDEADLGELIAVDEEHTIRLHVGDKENLAIGRDTDVLRHATLGERDIAENFALDEIDLRQPARNSQVKIAKRPSMEKSA